MIDNAAVARIGRFFAIPFGLCFAALGTIALLSVLGVLKGSLPSAPVYQVLDVCASVVFIAAGIGVTLFGIGLPDAAAKSGGVALLLFLVTFNWIAFGPGKRQFTSKTSSTFSATKVRPASELEGRTAFGIVALLMDVVLVYGLVKGRRRSGDS